MPILSKRCKYCKSLFRKTLSDPRRYCSKDCAYKSFIGRPSPKRGKIYPELRARNEKLRKYHPCRICGQSTKYIVSKDPNQVSREVRCDRLECIKAVLKIRNNNISLANKRGWASGTR